MSVKLARVSRSPNKIANVSKSLIKIRPKDAQAQLFTAFGRLLHARLNTQFTRRNFEYWLYQGTINHACKDLFVGYIDTYRPCTVFHFESAHFVRYESIPGFMDGLQEMVLMCGRYVHLLKTHNPMVWLYSITNQTDIWLINKK